MKNDTYEVGDLILDNYNLLGIIYKKIENIREADNFTKEKVSFKDWLDIQHDKRVRDYVNKSWVCILPLDGGSMYAPSELCKKVRKSTKEDFEIAMKNANEFGKDILKNLIN